MVTSQKRQHQKLAKRKRIRTSHLKAQRQIVDKEQRKKRHEYFSNEEWRKQEAAKAKAKEAEAKEAKLEPNNEAEAGTGYKLEHQPREPEAGYALEPETKQNRSRNSLLTK